MSLAPVLLVDHFPRARHLMLAIDNAGASSEMLPIDKLTVCDSIGCIKHTVGANGALQSADFDTESGNVFECVDALLLTEKGSRNLVRRCRLPIFTLHEEDRQWLKEADWPRVVDHGKQSLNALLSVLPFYGVRHVLHLGVKGLSQNIQQETPGLTISYHETARVERLQEFSKETLEKITGSYYGAFVFRNEAYADCFMRFARRYNVDLSKKTAFARTPSIGKKLVGFFQVLAESSTSDEDFAQSLIQWAIDFPSADSFRAAFTGGRNTQKLSQVPIVESGEGESWSIDDLRPPSSATLRDGS
ncbi:hypothetical protein QWI17_12330 [Gilvimarinus sp. SDUM040013]|uniref:Uncharacterized protein n=1 Tax=Gilvimarinus gilvus TaxID=3058038 RepID=A0ABU4S0X3_9GAMM|nr:hypothetical protein [Gilvimarinus sp. SDUM040013]MDO3386625.1 hypothetical protein [Gilvimarinus sp. SDUM040013]MDX6849488.1 hypothetical protein [Gilvimarinus sp. SDUM040013]